MKLLLIQCRFRKHGRPGDTEASLITGEDQRTANHYVKTLKVLWFQLQNLLAARVTHSGPKSPNFLLLDIDSAKVNLSLNMMSET